VTATILVSAAAAMTAAFGGMAWVGDLYRRPYAFVALFGLASAAYALAGLQVVRRPPRGRWALATIVLAAVLFRLVLWSTTPSLSTDIYRYLWDGRLAVAGVSPYRYPADAPELARFRDSMIYPGLNHPDWRTIYPPGAQLIFRGLAHVAPSDVWVAKGVLVLADLLALALLIGWLGALGQPPAWALLYAWHPLVVVEVAGSGHLDSVAVAASVGALWAATRARPGWAGALVGLAALVKLYPLLLLPAAGPRPGWRAPAAAVAVMGAGYALYAGEGWAVLGSLPRYVAEERFNGGLRALLEVGLAPLGDAGGLAARLAPLAALAVLALAVGASAWPVPQRALWLAGGYLLATPNLFPWYVLWVVPIAAALAAWPWLGLACGVGLAYLAFAEPSGRVPPWVVALEFAPLAAGLGAAAVRRWGSGSMVASAGARSTP
jgi:hypothetical protein